MDVESVVFDRAELEKLKASNLIKGFVSKQEGHWNHEQWEAFLASVGELGYKLPCDVIGAELEVEKEYYWKVRRGEIPVLEETAVSGEASVHGPLEEAESHGAKKELFDPITELENAVVVEEKKAVPRTADTWENVDFDTLSAEERIAYLKVHFKKKIGEG